MIDVVVSLRPALRSRNAFSLGELLTVMAIMLPWELRVFIGKCLFFVFHCADDLHCTNKGHSRCMKGFPQVELLVMIAVDSIWLGERSWP